jgi:polygalacturonase
MRVLSLATAITIMFAASLTSAQQNGTGSDDLRPYLSGLPFPMPAMSAPHFPDNSLSITDFGAVPDGRTMNTRAFAAAIGACVKKGGGVVNVPAGVWLTGPIKLESNINLHLDRGALIQFSNRPSDFPFIGGFDGKSKKYLITPPISAYRAKNIAITGYGVIDGAGEVWRYVKKDKLTERQWKDLIASGGVTSADGKEWWPSKEAMGGEETIKLIEQGAKPSAAEEYAATKEFLRPDLVRLVQCDGVLLDGPTFQNSPKFHVNPVQSENIVIRNIKILTDWYAQNGDGLDITASRNVLVYNSTINVGDDGICLKPGTIASSQKPGPACENIVIADCIVYHAHGGFVIGSESYGGARNIMVRNCLFVGTDIGLRFKSLRGKGGVIEKVFVDGIRMRSIATDAILFDMSYGGNAPDVESAKEAGARAAEPVNDKTPQFRDFSIANVVCDGAQRAVFVSGLPEMPIKGMTLSNVYVRSKAGVFMADAEGFRFENCRFDFAAGDAITLTGCKNITFKGGSIPRSRTLVSVAGASSTGIKLEGVEIGESQKEVSLGKDVPADAVTITKALK